MAQSWRAGPEPLCDHYIGAGAGVSHQSRREPGSRYLAGMALSLQIIASHESGGRRPALADQESQVSPSVEFNFSALLCKLNIPKLGGEG